MKRTILRGLATAVVMTVSIGTGRAEEIIALYTFNDMAALNNGTTRAVKETSVGLPPSLTLVEAGGPLADADGSTASPQPTTFIDVDGVAHSGAVSPIWLTGLAGAGNGGSNYFVLETSTLGFCDLTLRFDVRSLNASGPTGLSLDYAVGDGAFEPLAEMGIVRDSTWHGYETNLCEGVALEQVPRLRIKGTWSGYAASGANVKIDNLQLSGSFTNGLSRTALYTFSGSSRANSASVASFTASTLVGVNVSTFTYLTTSAYLH